MKKKRKEINDEDLKETQEKRNQWWGFKWRRRREEINDEDLHEKEEKGNQWWGFTWKRRERKSMMRI